MCVCVATLRLEIGTTGQIRKQTCVRRCVEISIENWARIPKALIAKAWVTTGLLSLEEALEASGFTEEEFSAVASMEDPTSLQAILGDCPQPRHGCSLVL